jgi:hypothetical protein
MQSLIVVISLSDSRDQLKPREDSGDDIKGKVILHQRHENPLAHDELDVHADEWEKTDGGLEA